MARRHVGEAVLPAPGNEAALLRLAAELLRPALDRFRPLWRMWLVRGLTDGQMALVVAIHHVVADGAAALELLASLMDASDVSRPAQVRATPPPRWTDLLRENLRARIGAVGGRWPRRRRHVGPRSTSLRRLLGPFRRTSRTSLNTPIGPRRDLAVLRFALGEVRRVSHKHQATINDTVLVLAAGAVRALLAGRGEAPDRLRLHAAVAVSLRIAGQPMDPGNRTGGILIRLPVEQADPIARFSVIHAEVASARTEQTPSGYGRAVQAQSRTSGRSSPVRRM